MEATSPSEMLLTLSVCVSLLVMIFAGVGGVFGALKARGAGAPGPGPLLVAGAFGLFIGVALWFGLFELVPASVLEWGVARRLLMILGLLGEALALAVGIAGLLLLKPPPKPGTEAAS